MPEEKHVLMGSSTRALMAFKRLHSTPDKPLTYLLRIYLVLLKLSTIFEKSNLYRGNYLSISQVETFCVS